MCGAGRRCITKQKRVSLTRSKPEEDMGNNGEETGRVVGRRRGARVAALLMAFGGAPVAAQTSPWQTIAHWRMDETTGGLMRNSAPNSPDGIWHDIIPGRIGFMGRAYGFNGFSSYVEVPDAPIFDLGTNSIRVTARVLTTMPGTSTGGNDLIKKGYAAKLLFKMEFYPDGRVSVPSRERRAVPAICLAYPASSHGCRRLIGLLNACSTRLPSRREW